MKDINNIDSFSGKYAFLSNFFECQIIYNEITYPTVEHAYQSQKTLNEEEKIKVIRAKHPREARSIGRKVVIRKDWEDIKIQIMEDLIRIKFMQNKDLQNKLLSTGNRCLIEGNTWGDYFWGVCNGKGENNLGKILMKIRSELQERLQIYDTND